MFSTIKRKGQKRHLVSISIILILVGSSIVSSINFPVIAYAQNDTSNVSSDDSNPGVEDENTNRGSQRNLTNLLFQRKAVTIFKASVDKI